MGEDNPLSVEALGARLTELEESRVNVLANLNAHNGALAELRRLIDIAKASSSARS